MALRLRPHPRLRTTAGGTVLIGGSPVTVLRLSETGAALVRRWFAGEEVGETEPHRQLASRLRDRNMAMVAEPAGPDRTLAVVIPVLDDLEGLRATLDSLVDDRFAPLPIVVVDDGSATPLDPAALEALARDNIEVVRRHDPGGPAAARNLGARSAAATAADVLVFIDAAVEASPEVLHSLIRFIDGPVAAAAPRVRSRGSETDIERYEAVASPLDLGAMGGRVRPGSEVSYVPSTCLAIARATFESLGGFDESMRFGEDVDLVWRLVDRGHVVEYAPELVVTHPPRTSLAALARQRFGYGTAAAPLSERHGDAVAPWRANGWSALIALATGIAVFAPSAIAAVGATGMAVWVGERVGGWLPDELTDRRANGHRLAFEGHVAATRGFSSALARPWWPVAAMAAATAPRPIRRVVLGLIALHRVDAARPHRMPDRVGAIRGVAYGLLDDLSYGTGVVAGAWRHRTLGPLRPAR